MGFTISAAALGLLKLLGSAFLKGRLERAKTMTESTIERERIRAKTEIAVIEAELSNRKDRQEAATKLAAAEVQQRFSATRIGRYLIVLPWGVWWCALWLVSALDLPFVVQKPPQEFVDMAAYLIPAICVADIGEIGLRNWRRLSGGG